MIFDKEELILIRDSLENSLEGLRQRFCFYCGEIDEWNELKYNTKTLLNKIKKELENQDNITRCCGNCEFFGNMKECWSMSANCICDRWKQKNEENIR